jgi:hypothetical protein
MADRTVDEVAFEGTWDTVQQDARTGGDDLAAGIRGGTERDVAAFMHIHSIVAKRSI